ncbi:MAG: N-glycosylase/DNA lyase [Patescibacteria group bacterium]|nr:N-glycosylase/DNA lyase [Patescibacteria group bacterium]MDD4304537.1 N-glycosylase/DNA lyase [Patescibacteria group bacterium]MDD4695645.1 N-glycosylase/DNA lyase [Patescibacteria group bacterium]
MKKLIKQIEELKKTDIKKVIDKRLSEFRVMNKNGNTEWFYELCFCLLTSNWKAKESIEIQKQLSGCGFLKWNEEKLAKFLKKSGHRFWPQRAERIVLARKYKNIKDILKNENDPRTWLVENIKGLGMKESSHFLRNVGIFDYAILDRHIINSLIDNRLIDNKKTLTPRRYLEIEKIMYKVCGKLNMAQGELDLYVWYLKTGKILK